MGFSNPAPSSIFDLLPSAARSVHAGLGVDLFAKSGPSPYQFVHNGNGRGFALPASVDHLSDQAVREHTLVPQVRLIANDLISPMI
jgi:hypothetical protein